MTATTSIIIVPGWRDSGPGHWQSLWAERLPHARRVVQDDWITPTRSAWVSQLEKTVLAAPQPVVIVAHSLGCIATTHMGPEAAARVRGALLVAPADPQRFSPRGVRIGTRRNGRRSLAADLPFTPLPFPSLVVASRNDPWMRLETVEHWAGLWGSAMIDIGEAGHINVDSGFGPWPQGLALLRALQMGGRRAGMGSESQGRVRKSDSALMARAAANSPRLAVTVTTEPKPAQLSPVRPDGFESQTAPAGGVRTGSMDYTASMPNRLFGSRVKPCDLRN